MCCSGPCVRHTKLHDKTGTDYWQESKHRVYLPPILPLPEFPFSTQKLRPAESNLSEIAQISDSSRLMNQQIRRRNRTFSECVSNDWPDASGMSFRNLASVYSHPRATGLMFSSQQEAHPLVAVTKYWLPHQDSNLGQSD